jgi:hypothetical protein
MLPLHISHQVLFLGLKDLSVVKEFNMPPPMHFKEEGGASLSPDGKHFIAVRNIMRISVYVCIHLYSTKVFETFL